MTAPTGIRSRKTTAAERRQQRANYQKLKAIAETCPEMAAYRAANRLGDYRRKVKLKVEGALADRRVLPFTATQLRCIRRPEAEALRERHKQRLAAMSEEERARLNARVYLVLALLCDEDFDALVRIQG